MKNSDYVLAYIRENPKVYFTVITLITAIGVFEILGVASILPVVTIYLGETNVLMPKLLEQIVQTIGMNTILVMFVATIFIQAFIAFIAETYFLKEMAIWRTQLSIEYIKNLFKADFSQISQLKPGEAEVIITRNVGYAVRNRHRTVLFLSDVILSIFYVLIAFFVSPYAFILFLLLGLIYALLHRSMINSRVAFSKDASAKYLSVAQLVSEYLADFRGLQATNKKNLLIDLDANLHKAGMAQKINDIMNAGMRIVSQPIMLILLFLGVGLSKLVFNIPNSQIIIMLYVFYRAGPKLIALARGYGEIIQDSPVDITPEIKKWNKRGRSFITDSPVALMPKLGILAENLEFSRDGKSLLRNVNFEIMPGELVVILGRSGSGKSTLLDLICGFIRPSNGKIKVWNNEPADMPYEDWLLPYVSLVRAESIVISGTLATNVALLQDNPDRNKIQELLEQVGLGFLKTGLTLDSEIEARGNNLSAGQRQRLLLARSLYKSPKFLILDEPTSNLDIKTEDEIISLIETLKGQMTIIVVSHRTNLVRAADKTFHISDGHLSIETINRTTND